MLPPSTTDTCTDHWCGLVCEEETGVFMLEATIGGEGTDSVPEQDVMTYCPCDHHSTGNG